MWSPQSSSTLAFSLKRTRTRTDTKQSLTQKNLRLYSRRFFSLLIGQDQGLLSTSGLVARWVDRDELKRALARPVVDKQTAKWGSCATVPPFSLPCVRSVKTKEDRGSGLPFGLASPLLAGADLTPSLAPLQDVASYLVLTNWSMNIQEMYVKCSRWRQTELVALLLGCYHSSAVCLSR